MRLKPELKGALVALFGVALVLVGIWVYTGIRLGIWTYPAYSRYVWLTANLSVARELWRGDIKAGDDVEQLISTWRPHVTNRFGRWVDLTWFPGGLRKDSISLIGVRVVAKDGVLVQASYYADDGLAARWFFNILAPDTTAEHAAAFREYVDTMRTEREKKAQQDGAANRSQPIRSETNSTSSAAGSDR